MTTTGRKLANPPIMEAVLDLDCDLQPTMAIESILEPAKERYDGDYPKFKTRYLLEHEFRADGDAPPQTSTRRGIQGYMFLQKDEKQLVQVRVQGFSFNRLAPYSSLDDYYSEIQRTWSLFVELAKPVQVTSIRLRYINRIPVALSGGLLELDEYLKLGPRLPNEERLTLTGFLNQYLAVEKDTGYEVKAILTSQKPEGGELPIILDITAATGASVAPTDWDRILATIESLRNLKNEVFYNTLREKCLQLFQ